jgi:membrane protein YqaA with SNARE-associated domain
MSWLEWLGLIGATFASATVLPFPSEAVVANLLLAHPDRSLLIVVVATVSNTLGGMTTYAIGRCFRAPDASTKLVASVRRWGVSVLLLAWLPVIGDGFCAVAGWLRVAWFPSLILMALGKGGRYLVIAYALT